MDAAQLIAELRPHLSGALVATDFDGTLAPLVPDPETSRPVAGAVSALHELAERGAQVAVITGRDARTVLRLGGSLADVPGLVVAGLYGAETWTAGELQTLDTPAQMEQLRARLPAVLDGADPAVWIEDKRLSLVVHTRRAADPEGELTRLRDAVGRLAGELGLEMHPGADVLEVRLPGYDKAGALARLADRRTAVLYLGDDRGDLPAFDQIRRLRRAGMSAYSVAVRSSRVAEVDGAADVAVSDPVAVVRLLGELAR